MIRFASKLLLRKYVEEIKKKLIIPWGVYDDVYVYTFHK